MVIGVSTNTFCSANTVVAFNRWFSILGQSQARAYMHTHISQDGWTALHLAAQEGHEDDVHRKVLLKRCALHTFTETVLRGYHLTTAWTYVAASTVKILDICYIILF